MVSQMNVKMLNLRSGDPDRGANSMALSQILKES